MWVAVLRAWQRWHMMRGSGLVADPCTNCGAEDRVWGKI